MSLINCPDCKAEVSSKAETCIKCGRKLRNKPGEHGAGCLLLAIGSLILFIILVSAGSNEPRRNTAEWGAASKAKKDAERPTPETFMRVFGRPDDSVSSHEAMTLEYRKKGAYVDFVRNGDDYRLFLMRDTVTGKPLTAAQMKRAFP